MAGLLELRRQLQTLRSPLRPRRGVALLNALLLMAVMTLLLLVGINSTTASLRATRTVKYNAQAYNIARAGLVDAINWFKEQPSQPVRDFVPVVLAGNPDYSDTWDPDGIDPGQAGGTANSGDNVNPKDKPFLGIVREYPLDKDQFVYARYEVGKVTKLEADSSGKLTRYSVYDKTNGWVDISQLQAKATSDVWEGVQDVSDNYGIGAAGSGLVWRIRSHGYIVRRDPNAPAGTLFFQPPNQVLDQAEMVTEIRRLNLKDYCAALHGNIGSNMTFNSPLGSIKIKATNGYGVMWNDGTSTNPVLTAGNPSTITGTSGQTRSSQHDALDWSEIFGVPDGSTLASMSDLVETNISNLPTKMPTMAMVYLKPTGGTATFSQVRPLNGGGILVVDGNLNIADYSGSLYSGYIYVTGNYYQGASSALVGEVVAKGTTTMGAPSDSCNLEYAGALLNNIRTQLGQYRERGSPQRIPVGTTP